jgi:chromosome segregation ATPase
MPPQTVLKSKPDEKDIELLDYSGAINQLNVIAKKELEDTRNQINTENYNLAMLRDRIVKQTNEFESWKRAERLKFQNEFSQRQNDIIAKQNRINDEVLQQERITIDLRTQQQRFEFLKDEQNKLKEALVKLEGRKIEVQDMATQVESQRSSVLTMQNQASMVSAKASEELEKTRQENIRLVALNDSLSKREKQLEEDIKNSKELKDFVEPKIRDIKIQQENLDNSINQNTETIARLQQTMQDEKILLQSILDKKAQLEKDTASFLSQKTEFERQRLLDTKPVVKVVEEA